MTAEQVDRVADAVIEALQSQTGATRSSGTTKSR